MNKITAFLLRWRWWLLLIWVLLVAVPRPLDAWGGTKIAQIPYEWFSEEHGMSVEAAHNTIIRYLDNPYDAEFAALTAEERKDIEYVGEYVRRYRDKPYALAQRWEHDGWLVALILVCNYWVWSDWFVAATLPILGVSLAGFFMAYRKDMGATPYETQV